MKSFHGRFCHFIFLTSLFKESKLNDHPICLSFKPSREAVAFWPILTKFLKQLGISNKGSHREFKENQFLGAVSPLIKSLQQEFSDSTA